VQGVEESDEFVAGRRVRQAHAVQWQGAADLLRHEPERPGSPDLLHVRVGRGQGRVRDHAAGVARAQSLHSGQFGVRGTRQKRGLHARHYSAGRRGGAHGARVGALVQAGPQAR